MLIIGIICREKKLIRPEGIEGLQALVMNYLQFTDYRLTKVFGHYLNIFQMAPIVWGVVAVVVFLIAKLSYDH